MKSSTTISPVICAVCWLGLVCGCTAAANWTYRERDICQGTSNGLTFNYGMASARLRVLREKYSDCTYVDGNLEIVGLDDESVYDADLTFLNSIREVTGYVLIASVYVRYLPLENLTIIRGDMLFAGGERQGATNTSSGSQKDNKYALYVSVNYKFGTTTGLQQLGLHNLSEISKGNVLFENNNFLCYATTHVNWEDILVDSEVQVLMLHQDNGQSTSQCGQCHDKCDPRNRNDGFCWGPSIAQCQKLNKVICAEQCDGRCFGTLPNACCHPECAAGCNGATKKDCWGCKHFYNDGRCEPYCPPLKIYDSTNFNVIPNPEKKFSFGTLCVDACPKNFLEHRGGCVRSCPDGFENVNMSCVECTGPCPKSCTLKWGVDLDFLNANNIESLAGCTIIDGHLRILDGTFRGDSHFEIPPLNLSSLAILNSIREITGYLNIDGMSQIRDLSFLSNLETIHGRETETQGGALRITHNAYLESLGLTSLKQISAGTVMIQYNPKLCYLTNFKWDKIVQNKKIFLFNNSNAADCERSGQVCHSQCKKGCWGPGDRRCTECRNYDYESRCVPDCNFTLVYANPPSLPSENLTDFGSVKVGQKTCEPCDKECETSCRGSGPDNCTSCKHYKDGPYCVEMCPFSKYSDSKDRECNKCHENCILNEGPPRGERLSCSGPNNTVGVGGCDRCEFAIADDTGSSINLCLPVNASACPDGYYPSLNAPSPLNYLKGYKVCLRCHKECETCVGAGSASCITCKHYTYESQCTEKCPLHYFANNVTRTCDRCHDECHKMCSGPSEYDCIGICKNFKVNVVPLEGAVANGTSGNSSVAALLSGSKFYCTKDCPLTMPFKSKQESDDVCQSEDPALTISALTSGSETDKGAVIGGSVAASVVVVIGLGVLIAFFCRQRALSQENTLRLTMKLTGLEEEAEPLTPTTAKPDLAKLRLIRESELRKGGIIGSGAFGTVYKGVWIPEGENVKIPVAIKVLQEGTTPEKNKELLEEARVMASVENVCCVRILAVCMTVQMMLVTQLMPLGCLLDYVRKHKDNVGSKVLLNWCTQIARGMAYLESQDIVHRDLAARNVLVQSANQIKITDFGLAKLLDYNEDQYHAAGGKMPIKWLALESIQHRIFTHMTDVWSFGVTLWELFTYGQRPYESVRAHDVPDLLEKGERLPQPSICTIDVYMIMIKCWMLNAESRPKFTELANEFSKMARDPGRYLVIQGDTLMRLPSSSYDARDIVRNLSVAGGDGPEEVIEAEEYLQPTETIATGAADICEEGDSLPEDETDSASVNVSKVFGQSQPNASGAEGGGSSTDSGVVVALTRDKKYANLENAAINKDKRRVDSLNSRYSSEPCKALSEGANAMDEFSAEDGLMLERSEKSPASSPVRLRNKLRSQQQKKLQRATDNPSSSNHLPVDEDDYLQPRSHNPAAYVDLLDDGAVAGERKLKQRQYMSSNEQKLKASQSDPQEETQPFIENPEYFETNCDPSTECLNDQIEYYNELKGAPVMRGTVTREAVD